ncbi:extracellular solute-binding protein [Cohnella silvisoli]|uniref:Extracellular solute-binding protein n=1 Tax=Cohnella silvisoli TaxID=2873699 RepID=A0ABV1KMF2_9BACL|nr:extracellular solute-binding protein [Cohnella silvisoli]MCD9020405.1 extracellular solute-binding protein [Cohnella silvisoli]
MKVKRLQRIMLIALMLMLVWITACSKAEENTQSTQTIESSATDSPSTQAASEENTNPLGKYDPPITLSTVKIFSAVDKFAPGETPEKNIWTDGYLKDLGIDMKINWSVVGDEPGGAGEQKLNIAIASNDLPDIIPVNAKQMKQLVDNGMAEDLTDAIAKYASPLLKKFLAANDGLALKTGTFNGKVLALPVPTASIDTAAMIWIRKDWLDKLQLPEPKTMSDILKISDAFTNQDPDGNKEKDSFGISLSKDLYTGGLHELTGFLEGYHAYRNLWLKDTNGRLVYSGIQPEMKTALAKLQEMFKAGQIDPEFGVKDNGKVNESVISGKIGMFYGSHWNAFWPLPDSFKQDPKAVWKPYPIVSADDKPAIPSIGLGVNPESVNMGYAVFKKGSKHPEAMIKLANYYADKEYGWETGGYNEEFHQPNPNPDGYGRWRFAAVYAPDPDQNINIYRGVKAAVENNDQNALKNLQAKGNYDIYQKFIKDHDQGSYGNAIWAGPKDTALSILDYYMNNKLGISDMFFGSKTDTMVKKQSTLDKLQLETFTKILMGAVPVDAFDQFVSDWKKLGGDKMTQEVNDWYAAQK